MNALILNRESFSLPEDGWYHLAPLGVFPHAASGVVQVVDTEACEAMVSAFGVEAAGVNFAGLLIDFDHFSLDAGNKSEAAGWITALEARGGSQVAGSRFQVSGSGEEVSGSEGEEVSGSSFLVSGSEEVSGSGEAAGLGLWAKIRWSDIGEAAVRGGRYRFLSPVWSRADCVDLGDGRLRPVRLLNAAVTNDPNLKGMVPLSNSRAAAVGIRDTGYGIRGPEILANAEGEKLLKWVLGDSLEDRHCPSCSALAGQVHSAAEWETAGLRPKSDKLFCGEHCHCRLVETDEASQGDLVIEELRNSGFGMRIGVEARGIAEIFVKEAKKMIRNNWSEEARAASLEVRRAKAAKRKADKEAGAADGDQKLRPPVVESIREKLRKGERLTPAEERHLEKLREEGYAGDSDSDPIAEWMERRKGDEGESEDIAKEDLWRKRDERAKDLKRREQAGEELSEEDKAFLAWYRRLLQNRRGPSEVVRRAKEEWRRSRG